MNRVIKIALILLVASFFVLGTAFASDYTFKEINIQIENSAKVNNTVNTSSNTGGNTTTTTGGNSNATVQTGNAGSNTIVCNDVNHTVINANSGQTCPSGSGPTPTSAPIATPTPGPSGCTDNCGTGKSGGGSGGSGGGSSNNSSGSSSGSSSQGVLGASTMAGTGTFETNLMNVLFAAGVMALGAGLFSYKKERSY